MNNFEQIPDELPQAVEDQIERAMDSQGLSYVDAREQVLGTTRAQRSLGMDVVRKTTVAPKAQDSHPELDIFGEL